MIPVCRLEDLPAGESVRLDTTPPVAVFNADGALYAVDDTCSHQDASLSEGWLEGCLVECPLHAASFDLRTGEPTCLPARRPVRTHRVSVVDGTIHVHLTDPTVTPVPASAPLTAAASLSAPASLAASGSSAGRAPMTGEGSAA
ncbi:bifunctional 3-phenylpropionate/cinnamic acid dioxygenase ferredoxin subunit [Streptomyces flavofungini]|uniref:bifunctional 3-phenylpropionate/cinnamic acid dioxygenase ferredoxin subunit n=1 Tax=Streptomyces flavofungini TaxID=68200 RepID=UPI0025B274E3|nr:bifunctional 3-phenylpropionate/cinnamic acid dioxygenase ferredoxin subunit [Streptomyces flavofungini]WJV50129.1 bifunctional 3-phenylpropionate/cinnamic acid dioxygenase ferredoxin subunit [Streptomyces flavofungini]